MPREPRAMARPLLGTPRTRVPSEWLGGPSCWKGRKERELNSVVIGDRWRVAVCALSLAIGGCGDGDGVGGSGNLSVLLEAEPTIVDGLQSGSSLTNIRDGFDVSYTRHIIALGLVSMSQLDGQNRQRSDVVAVADFARLPPSLPELVRLEAIPTGQYTSFGFGTPAPGRDVVNINSVPDVDVNAMVERGWSFIVEGSLTRVSDGAIKVFRIEADVPVVYTDCGIEGSGAEPGVNVGPSSAATITMHGDHLFFNGFPADESSIVRLAQWMWDVDDVDGDDVLTRADFEVATDVGSLFPSPPYTLSGGPLTVNSAWDFVRAQLGTAGHIFGEGGCEWNPF